MKPHLDLDTLRDLPGAEMVERGIRDGENNVESVESLLVGIAAPRLSRLGIQVPPACIPKGDAEVRLYERLGSSGVMDPYSRYNALLRELVSFSRALERRVASKSR
jgi:hypothetical protein